MSSMTETSGRATGTQLVERHGIDYIPPNERHGKPINLLSFWGASNIQMLAISVGALMTAPFALGGLSLSLGWAIGAIIIGNAVGGLYMALHSVQGPRLGLPQMMQSRAQFGMYGTALPNVIVILMYLGYFTASAVLGGEALRDLIHVTVNEGIIIFNVVNLLIVWFGYDLFHAFNRAVSVLSTIIFFCVLGVLLTKLPSHLPASTSDTGGLFLLAISIIAAWQITWAPYVSDYSRYLPEDTPAWKTFSFTFVGSVVGACLVMTIGAVAALIAAGPVAGDAPGYLGGLLAAKWLFLIVFFLGLVSGSFPNLYGPFLTFFAIISPSGKLASKTTGTTARIATTTVLAVIGTVAAIKASTHFMTDLNHFLIFTLYLLVPWTAINLTDYYLIRHGKYDIPELFKTNGRYGQLNWYALIIYAVTVGVELPFMNSPWYVGPVSNSLGGADIAWLVGFVFASVVYYAAARFRMSRHPQMLGGDLGSLPMEPANAETAPTV